MATTTTPRAAAAGGSFLIESPRPEDVFTPAELTDDQRLIGQTAEEFVANEVMPLIPDLEQHKPGLMAGPAEESRRAGSAGQRRARRIRRVRLGQGVQHPAFGKNLHLRLVQRQPGRALPASARCPSSISAPKSKRRKYLPKLASGELLGCYCLSEPQAGSDAQNSKTRAVLSSAGKHWILNGQKMWISNGGFADLFIVFAKVDGEKFSCFIVERSFPGFSVGAEEKKMGLKGSSTAPIFFRELPGAQGKSAARNRPRPHRGLQHPERRPSDPGRVLHRRLEESHRRCRQVRERTRRLRQAHRRIRPGARHAGQYGHPHLCAGIHGLSRRGHDRSRHASRRAMAPTRRST